METHEPSTKRQKVHASPAAQKLDLACKCLVRLAQLNNKLERDVRLLHEICDLQERHLKTLQLSRDELYQRVFALEKRLSATALAPQRAVTAVPALSGTPPAFPLFNVTPPVGDLPYLPEADADTTSPLLLDELLRFAGS